MSALCFIDTETTGLDPRIHQPYEACIWHERDKEPVTYALPHTLENADPKALEIGGYFDRGHHRLIPPDQITKYLLAQLQGVTLVGSNPSFDAAMLQRSLGAAVWHHRMIDVASAGMWVFGWDRPKGLADVAAACREYGNDIPEPDHTAEGDVRTTRAVYLALRDLTRSPA